MPPGRQHGGGTVARVWFYFYPAASAQRRRPARALQRHSTRLRYDVRTGWSTCRDSRRRRELLMRGHAQDTRVSVPLDLPQHLLPHARLRPLVEQLGHALLGAAELPLAALQSHLAAARRLLRLGAAGAVRGAAGGVLVELLRRERVQVLQAGERLLLGGEQLRPKGARA